MSDADLSAGGPAAEPPAEEHAAGTEGGRPAQVLAYLASRLVDDPAAVSIDSEEARSGLKLSLRVAPDDMGKVIGRRGRIAQSIRSVVRAAGARDGVDVSVDIVD